MTDQDLPDRIFIAPDCTWNADPIEPCMTEYISAAEYYKARQRIRDLSPAKAGSLLGLLDTIRDIVGPAWAEIENPAAYIREIRGDGNLPPVPDGSPSWEDWLWNKHQKFIVPHTNGWCVASDPTNNSPTYPVALRAAIKHTEANNE